MSTITTEATIQALRDLIARFGIPEILVSDNGPQLVAHEFEDFLIRMGIKHIRSAPYHPQSNGAVERCVQTFKAAMKSMLKEPGKLLEKLASFLFQYRNTPHSTTGVAPTELFLKREVRTRLAMLKPDHADRIRKKQLLQQKQAPQSNRQFDVGEKVWMRNYQGTEKWKDGTVIERSGEVDYKVQGQDGVTHRHSDQLKRDRRTTTNASTVPVDEQVETGEGSTDTNMSPTGTEDAPVTESTELETGGSTSILNPVDTGVRRNPTRNRRPPERLDL